LLLYGVLFIVCLSFIELKDLQTRSLRGMNGQSIFLVSLAMAPIHHFFVWFVWRGELCYQRISPLFGGKGFRIYAVGFAVIAIIRFLSVLLMGFIDAHSITIHWSITWILAPLMAALALYTIYSAMRYFGYDRAIGADHFFTEYREMPFVRKGVFRYTSNAMYAHGLLLFFLPGIWCSSETALILAGYHYIAAWIHYFCTEKTDINLIYVK